jgi:hypothetical protein
MAGLVPAIHVLAQRKTGMPGTRPGMTTGGLRPKLSNRFLNLANNRNAPYYRI